MQKPFEKKLIVPFTDVSVNPSKFQGAIAKVLKAGDYILGKEVENFEKDFARYIGAKFCVGVASGTDALFLALKTLGVSVNDEVICSRIHICCKRYACSDAWCTSGAC